MAVYNRGAKGVFYMNFTVDKVRVTRSTGKSTKKEAKLVEAVEKKRMMVDGALSPRERAARMLLSLAIKKTYAERLKDNKDGHKSLRLAERAMELMGDIRSHFLIIFKTSSTGFTSCRNDLQKIV
jgi:hypothetical protein